jgi:hypothetical protein
MRELKTELGIRFEILPGPKRKLTAREARAITTLVMSRPRGEREAMIDRLADHMAVGKTTLKRAIEPYRGKPVTIRLAGGQKPSPIDSMKRPKMPRGGLDSKNRAADPQDFPSERIIAAG